MIRNDIEREQTYQRLVECRNNLAKQRAKLEAMGIEKADVQRGLEPLLAICTELEAEIDEYDGLKRGDVDPIESFEHLGRALVGLRIASGLTQRQLAERLGVHESQVSRDERNEYHGLTIERARRIFEALGVRTTTAFNVPPRAQEGPPSHTRKTSKKENDATRPARRKVATRR
jgi:transcriptional regulator with XRE-family HTH domain